MEAEGVVFQPRLRRRRVAGRGDAAARSSTRWSSPAASRSAATCRFPAASSTASTSRWTSCRSRTSRCEGDAVAESQFITATGKHVVIIGGGDTGADCLGTAHRQGAAVGAPVRAAAEAAGDRAPPTTRGRSGRTSSASRRRTKRAASGSTRCRRRSSSATSTGRVRALDGVERRSRVKEDGRLTFKPVPGTEFELAGRSRPAGDGLHRRRGQGPGRTTSAWR